MKYRNHQVPFKIYCGIAYSFDYYFNGTRINLKMDRKNIDEAFNGNFYNNTIQTKKNPILYSKLVIAMNFGLTNIICRGIDGFSYL